MPSLSRNTRWLLVLLLATTVVVLTSNPLREIFHTASSSSDGRAGDRNLSPQDIGPTSRATKSKRPSEEERLLAQLAAMPVRASQYDLEKEGEHPGRTIPSLHPHGPGKGDSLGNRK